MLAGFIMYEIVLLGKKDVSAVAALEKSCFSTHWDEATYEKILAGVDEWREKNAAAAGLPPFAPFGLMDAEGRLVGYVTLVVCQAARELEVHNVAVDREFRGHGLGCLLFSECLKRAAQSGIESGFLEVRPSNAAAIALYEKTGFRQTGVRPRYYADTGEDALVFGIDLKEIFT